MRRAATAAWLLLAGCRAEAAAAPPITASNVPQPACPAINLPPASTIVLEMSSCLGACPVFLLEIRPDGTVFFVGKRFVREHGIRMKTIPKRDAEALFAMVDCGDFWKWTDFKQPIDDVPSATLSVVLGERRKTIEDEPPCHKASTEVVDLGPATPRGLCALESAIVTAADVRDWVECIDAGGVHVRCAP